MGIVKCDTLKQAHFVFDQLAKLRRVASLPSENRNLSWLRPELRKALAGDTEPGCHQRP